MELEGTSTSGKSRRVSSEISLQCLDDNARFSSGLYHHAMKCIHHNGIGSWFPSPSDCEGESDLETSCETLHKSLNNI